MQNPYIGRLVVLLAPVIAALSLFVVNTVQDLIGVNLNGTELTALLTTAVAGTFALVFKWLENRGRYEDSVQNAEIFRESVAAEESVPVDQGYPTA